MMNHVSMYEITRAIAGLEVESTGNNNLIKQVAKYASDVKVELEEFKEEAYGEEPPLNTHHNNLMFIQGGNVGERYHVDELQHTNISNFDFENTTIKIQEIDDLAEKVSLQNIDNSNIIFDGEIYTPKVNELIIPIANYHVRVDGNDMNDGSNYKNGFATLNHAVDVANDGELILIYPGTYVMNSEIVTSKNITIKGVIERFNNQEVILDGQNLSRAFSMSDNFGFKLSDITFQNFQSASNGGAININNTSSNSQYQEILGCKFINCYSQTNGGAVYLNRSARIVGCEFTNCSNSSGAVGGAAFCLSLGAQARNCLVHNCISSSNGAVFIREGTCQLHNCNIVNNNRGVAYYMGIDHQIYNCIIRDNTEYNLLNISSTADIRHTNSVPQPVGINNIQSDPKFQIGSYKLQPDSPCIDTGIILDWHQRYKDFYSKLRMMGSVCIGISEYYASSGDYLTLDEANLLYASKSTESKVQNISSVTTDTTFTGNVIADNLTIDNETRLGTVESNVSDLETKTQYITTGIDTTTVSGNLISDNLTIDNETRLGTVESKVQNISSVTTDTTFTGNVIADNLTIDNETRLSEVESNIIPSNLVEYDINKALKVDLLTNISIEVSDISVPNTGVTRFVYDELTLAEEVANASPGDIIYNNTIITLTFPINIGKSLNFVNGTYESSTLFQTFITVSASCTFNNVIFKHSPTTSSTYYYEILRILQPCSFVECEFKISRTALVLDSYVNIINCTFNEISRRVIVVLNHSDNTTIYRSTFNCADADVMNFDVSVPMSGNLNFIRNIGTCRRVQHMQVNVAIGLIYIGNIFTCTSGFILFYTAAPFSTLTTLIAISNVELPGSGYSGSKGIISLDYTSPIDISSSITLRLGSNTFPYLKYFPIDERRNVAYDEERTITGTLNIQYEVIQSQTINADIESSYISTHRIYQPITTSLTETNVVALNIDGTYSDNAHTIGMKLGAGTLTSDYLGNITTSNNLIASNLSLSNSADIENLQVKTVHQESNSNVTTFKNMVYADQFLKNISLQGTTYHVQTGGLDTNDGLNYTSGFLTIQYAVDTCSDGDSILIYPGTYPITVEIVCNKNIHIRGLHELGEVIIDGQGATRILYCANNYEFIIEGITLFNGYTLGTHGGTTPGSGGGLCFDNNVANTAETGQRAIKCKFSDCYAQAYGGGAYLFDHRASVIGCEFTSCSNGGGSVGGGALALRWECYARNCLIHDCSTASYGIVLCRDGTNQVHNCAIINNQVGSGIAYYLSNPEGHQIYNCIVYGNGDGNFQAVAGSIDIRHTDSIPAQTGINNFNADPLFMDYGDFKLQSTSPCINRGMKLPWHDLYPDFYGNNRVVGSPCVGIHEYQPDNPESILQRVSSNNFGALSVYGSEIPNSTITTENQSDHKRVVINSDSNNSISAIELHSGKQPGARHCYIDMTNSENLDYDLRTIISTSSPLARCIKGGTQLTGYQFEGFTNVNVSGGTITGSNLLLTNETRLSSAESSITSMLTKTQNITATAGNTTINGNNTPFAIYNNSMNENEYLETYIGQHYSSGTAVIRYKHVNVSSFRVLELGIHGKPLISINGSGQLNNFNFSTTTQTSNIRWPSLASINSTGSIYGVKDINFCNADDSTVVNAKLGYDLGTNSLTFSNNSIFRLSNGMIHSNYTHPSGFGYSQLLMGNDAPSPNDGNFVNFIRLVSNFNNGTTTVPMDWNIGHVRNSNKLDFKFNNGGFTASISPSGSPALNTTIEHLTISDDDLQLGDVVEITGDVIKNEYVDSTQTRKLDFVNNPENVEPNNCCPKIMKCISKTKRYIGVVIQIINEDDEIEHGTIMKETIKLARKCYRFASHGDCLLRVSDSSVYNVGDTILSDLSILDDDTPITGLIMSCIIGKVTRIIDDNRVAIFM